MQKRVSGLKFALSVVFLNYTHFYVQRNLQSDFSEDFRFVWDNTSDDGTRKESLKKKEIGQSSTKSEKKAFESHCDGDGPPIR